MIRPTPLLLLALVGCNGNGNVDEDTDTDLSEPTCDDAPVCPEPVQAACAGDRTPVALDEATSPCDDAILQDDAPAGYPLGATPVTFTDATRDLSCTVEVTVTDEDPPEVDCPSTLELASHDGAAVAVPVDELLVESVDPCTGEAPPVLLETSEVEPGTTTVTWTATDAAGNVGICTTDVTVLDLGAPTGLQVLAAEQAGETTDVTLGWTPSEGLDAAYTVLETAPDADGPWSASDRAGDRIATLTLDGDRTWVRAVAATGALRGGATDPLEIHAIGADTYWERDVEVRGIPFDTDLYGVVRHPADLDDGPYPLVVLLHGNHGNCRLMGTGEDYCAILSGHDCPVDGYEPAPNAEGMAFQAEALAAQGFIAVALSGNAMNCRRDYIFERTSLILGHLQAWADWNDGDNPWAGTVDLSRVGLIGHSRGGEAVAHVPRFLDEEPIAGVEVRSVFSIAPVDFHDPAVAETPVAMLVPACDGDVRTLVGRDIFDRTVALQDGTSHAQVFMMGANHNSFSTEWSYNDGQRACPAGTQVTARAQQGWLESAIGPWFRSTLLDDGPLRADVRAEARTPACVEDWAGEPLDTRWTFAPESRARVDDFTGGDVPDTNDLGEANTFTDLRGVSRCYGEGCHPGFDHQVGAITVSWRNDAAVAAFGLGGLDVPVEGALSFRAVSATSSLNVLPAQAFDVVLIDGSGNEAVVPLSDLPPVPHLYDARNVREILQSVRLPIATAQAANPDLDATDLAALELRFDDGTRGAIRIADVWWDEGF